MTDEHPLEYILSDIQQALNAGFYYVAVAMSLTVPDICAAMASANGRSGTSLYHDWYNDYLAHLYPEITPVDIYSLRCGIVHQGRMGTNGTNYSRIIFTLPNNYGYVLHRNIMDDALNLDAITFCSDIILGARQWCAQNADNPHVVQNLPYLVRHRPTGISPYIGGVPVIA